MLTTISTIPRLFQLATTTPQLQVGWSNYDNTPTVYLTSDPHRNVVTVTVQNGLPGALTFTGGAPAPYDAGPAGSAIYVAFRGLLSTPEIQSIQVAAGGWSAASYNDTQLGEYLCLAPDATVTLASGDSIGFTFSGFTCAGPTASGYVEFMLDQVPAYTGMNPVQVNIQVANPPQAKNQVLNLEVGFANTDAVVTGTTANQLVLYLSNPETTALVQGAWTATPTLQLNFVFDPGAPDALTTAENGAQIAVNLGDTYGNDWCPVAAYTSGPSPYWVMQPAADNTAVLGPGNAPNATVSFDISGIVTTLPPGVTLATLSYWNFPGYNDGQFVLPIVKVDPVLITRFQSTVPDVVANPAEPPTGTLSFTVENAGFVLITNTEYAKQADGSSFSDSCAITVQGSTTYTLIATNFNTAQQACASVSVQVTPDPYHALPAGAIVMWSGSSDSVPAGWAVCNGQTVSGFVTPNLINQFVLGADPAAPGDGTGEAVGQSGQADQHTHTFTVDTQVQTTGTDGDHQHTFTVTGDVAKYSTGDDNVTIVWSVGGWAASGLEGVSGNGQTNSGEGSHSHSFQVTQDATETSSQDPGNARPAWYALFFIMKCY